MAVFQYNNRTIPYRIALGPFHFDIVLLQSSREGMEFWDPVVEDLKDRPYAGGRILICQWADDRVHGREAAADFVRLMETLALVSVRIMALGDATDMAIEAMKIQPRLFEKTLFFQKSHPKGDDLIESVLDLCRS